jgi:coniferyl-aldehyde dehydrogenase
MEEIVQEDETMSAAREDVVRSAGAEVSQRMRATLDRQRESFLQEGRVSPAARLDRLDRMLDLVVTNKGRFADALRADFDVRPAPMSMMTDILPCVNALKHARKHVREWMRPEKRKVDFPLGLLGAKAWIEYQPKGVIGCVSPWNFPVNLSIGPMAGMLAAGNRVMLKPSEFTPATSDLLKELLETQFDETEIAVFTGGPEVGVAFSQQPFDHLLFTGATSIGRHIMRAAAENLVPVTLELGGKSPVIISDTADISDAAHKIMLGKLMNAGQICLAPDYLLVPEQNRDALVNALQDAAVGMYPTLADNADYTSIINERNAERLRGYVTDAAGKGARVTEINPANEDFGAAGNKVVPAIVENVDDSMAIMQDEIFGPLLPIKTYGRIDEAIEYINARERPLGLYYFGTDKAEQQRVLNETTSGGVTINDVIWHVMHEDLPFGGVGPSGMGSYHGHEGFLEFSHRKSVFQQAKIGLAKLIGMVPPYGSTLEKTLRREIRK